jgi:MoxR-like ATPase
MSTAAVERVNTRMQAVADEVARAIVGKEDVIRLVLASLLGRGHVLIEDVPGVGKTTLAKAVAKAIGCSFSRIQFTPDLLPSDVTGTSIFNQKTSEFEFRHGPLFANVVLADEINRTTPKTQSALLESMEELQVTSDGVTRPLPKPFLVIATQNNIEHGSTYPLPEAQLDRFLIRVSIGYPSKEDEVHILDTQRKENPLADVTAIMTADELSELQEDAKDVHLDDSLKDYIVEIVTATRKRRDVLRGASPRGSLALMRISRSFAAISGRDYVLPDDIKATAAPVLAHRLMLAQDVWNADAAYHIVRDILTEIPVPVTYGRH